MNKGGELWRANILGLAASAEAVVEGDELGRELEAGFAGGRTPSTSTELECCSSEPQLSSSFSLSFLPMAISDVESYAGRVSPGPFQHRRRPSSPISSTSLNQEHITDALAKSEDNGATLDFSHRGLTDVGEYGAEELAAIGREDHVEDESSVAR